MTTYAHSTIQLYTDALIANLKARQNLQRVLISDGPPPASWLAAEEWVMFGDVTGNQSWAVINKTRRPRNEEFTIEVIISVIANTTDGDDAVQPMLNARCMEIFAELEDELRGNPTQGVGPATGIDPAGYVIESEISTPVTLAKRGNDHAREASMTIGIKVKARL